MIKDKIIFGSCRGIRKNWEIYVKYRNGIHSNNNHLKFIKIIKPYKKMQF